ncbi:MAG: twin-arginine translocase TatA/TatE family subunit [Acidobacteriota bacterium]|jgi:TatA/E family protein of Tat protein translocase|nr:MAG: twin-arginine translocase subunit TatB [Acidobacteriota bacterium]
MGPLGVWELVVIFVVALIVFGPRKLPELGRSLGKSLSEFKRASNELRSTLDDEIRMEERRQATARAASTPATPPPATEPAATSAPDAEAAFDAAESGAEPETVARESRA